MAQQRPESQQHCILVYWPGRSPAQRPPIRAEKHVPIRWSAERERRRCIHKRLITALLLRSSLAVPNGFSFQCPSLTSCSASSSQIIRLES